MGQQVCMGAMMQCSFGMAPSSLCVLPTKMVMTSKMPAATIMDHIPLVNVLPFRHVQIACQPDGCRCHGRGSGSANANALYPCDNRPLASWLAYGSARQNTSTQRF